MRLSERLRQIELKGIEALNPFKTNYDELYALSSYLNVDFIKSHNVYFLIKNKRLLFKSKEARKTKFFLVELLREKIRLKEKKELKKLSDIRLKELRKMKHNEQIKKANENGLFTYEELIS